MTGGTTRTHWPVVRLVATRLVLRDKPPSTRIRRMFWIFGVIALTGVALQLLGVSHLALVAVIGVSGMLTLVAACLWIFPPAMAVSVIGVALACASLMTALSVTTGFQLEITRAMARFNGHVLITKYGLDFFEYEQVADRWRDDPRVTAASPFAFSMVAVVGGVEPPRQAPASEEEALLAADPTEFEEDGVDERSPVVVVGKGMDPARARELDGLLGIMGTGDLSGLRPGDTAHLPGIILGEPLAKILGVEVGDHVRVVVPAENDGRSDAVARPPKHATFEVLDLFSTGTSEFDRNLALMHITAAQALFFQEARVTGIELELRDAELAEEVAQDVMDSGHEHLRVTTWRETNSAMLIGLRQIRATISMVLGLMVVVAASSLIASLLLVVRRKRHDIAVLMSVGSDNALVFWMFEAVGVIAGLAGAVMGLGLGAIYCIVIEAYHYPLGGDIYPVDHLPVVVRPIDALGPAGAAVALCALASGPVAALAARVRVIESMKR